MIARRIFLVCALAALPGALWQALEMYGLTLGGAQMLFFSFFAYYCLQDIPGITAGRIGLMDRKEVRIGGIGRWRRP